MKRVLIYSQNLEPGDLRCMRALAQRLLRSSGQVQLGVISGTPASAEAPEWRGIECITLAGVRAPNAVPQAARRPALTLGAVLQLRLQSIRNAISEFAPDLLLVDKMPFGMYDELSKVLATLTGQAAAPKCVLLLRDLIGCPQRTAQQWRERGYFDAISKHYEKVLVLGEREVFDLRREYSMPDNAAAKLEYCGYMAAAPGRSERVRVRRALGVNGNEPLVLVTAGHGHDGEALIRHYLDGLKSIPAGARPRSHIVCGEGMRESERLALACAAHALPQVTFQHVSRDVMSLMSAADVVVANGSYQKTCELLTLRCRAVVVPASAEGTEQTLRAERLAAHGLLRLIRPAELQAQRLVAAVLGELLEGGADAQAPGPCSVSGIEFVTSTLLGLMNLEAEAESRGGVPSGSDGATVVASDSGFDLSLRIPQETGSFGPARASTMH